MSEICNKVTRLFNSMERFKFPFDESKIPKNGIYVLFERGQKGHGLDRIVRIGTHTGKDQLRSRLFQHFINENKDRSIFRKNIGRTLLNKANDPFLKSWELDLTTKKAREKFAKTVNMSRQKEIEKEVTRYIQDNFSFVVFEILQKDRRLDFESKLISTISLCKECKPSKGWLGLFSPKERIKEGGLWQVNEIYKKQLNDKEFGELQKITRNLIKE
jgi:hypothetical protein